jgi:transposase
MDRNRMILTNSQWHQIKELLPSQAGKQGRPRKNDRLVIEGILWVLRTGAPWRDLPKEKFGSWATIYGRWRDWILAGVWNQIFDALKKKKIINQKLLTQRVSKFTNMLQG